MNITSVLNTQTVIQGTAIDETDKTVTEQAKADAEKQKVDFLELLLTQLQNQNPLDPMDTDEWTAQLTRYSQLEQQISTNEKLTVTNSLLSNSATSNAFTYIGQDVELNSNVGVVQDGEATWTYEVQGDADDVVLTVTDGSGNILATEDGSTINGVHEYNFDAAALGLSNGAQLILNVQAKNEDKTVASEITSHVTVDGVWSDTEEVYLTAGEISFRTTDVLKIQQDYMAETVAAAQ